MTRTDSTRGRAVLMTTHCAGMMDMVALPVWVGTLVAGYRFAPQQAGLVVTLFLFGAVVASAVFAPRFGRLNGRRVAVLGFGGAALAFVGAATWDGILPLALLHAAGGFAAGAGLSMTHGTIGRSANPHRLFGLVGMALGLFSVAFLGGMVPAVAAWGPSALFKVFALVMAIAFVAALLAFPLPDAESSASRAERATGARLSAAVWFGIVGVGALSLVQAMVFSFVERIGAERGFGDHRVAAALVAIAIVTIFPAGLAALLQRLNPRAVVVGGVLAQAALAMLVTHTPDYLTYVVSAALMVFTMLFTHTFAFGLLARLDPSGRAVSATPAMVMVGSAVGPVLGGTLVQAVGYGALGLAALAIDALALAMFLSMNRRAPRVAAALPA